MSFNSIGGMLVEIVLAWPYFCWRAHLEQVSLGCSALHSVGGNRKLLWQVSGSVTHFVCNFCTLFLLKVLT